MSEAKRYAMTWATDEDEFVHVSPVESASGKWVNFEDYARLKAFSDEAQAHIAKEERKSRERLDMEQAENARLKAEFERLTQEYSDATNHYNKLHNNLQAEVELLRKAGDELLNEWQSNNGADVYRFTKAYWLWITAKENKPNV